LIDLYNQIQIIIYGNQEKYDYECSGSGIGKNIIDFSIIMAKDKPLPYELTELFFDKIDLKYQVKIQKRPRFIEIKNKQIELCEKNEDRYCLSIFI
jgi:hypothetical protein